MMATKLFNDKMTHSEAREVFYSQYQKAKTPRELEELTAAYKAIIALIFTNERIEAGKGMM